MSKRTFGEIINEIAAMDFTVDALGDPDSPETKAYQAARAELVEALGRARGIEFVTYEQFRRAFDAGAPREVLVDLKAGMDKPNDPLYQAAADDLKERRAH